MAKWEIEYYDEGLSELAPLAAQVDQVYEELSGDSYASFFLPNTAANRALVASDKSCIIWYDNEPMYVGVLSAVEYGRTRLKCTLYDEVMHLLDRALPISGFYDQVPASTILAAAAASAGVSVGSCPSTAISVALDDANCLDVAKFIADCLGKDLWSYEMQVYVGDRGSAKSLSVFTVSKRGVDRSKKYTGVLVKGVNKDGVAIAGQAGSSANMKVYREKTPSDIDTLASLASKYLAELSSDSSGAPVETVISEGAGLFVGDSVSITKPEFALSGSYRIVQTTKQRATVSLQLDRLRPSIDKAVADMKKYEDLGIYSAGNESPWSLNLQGLLGLYHLNEGTETTAKDTSPDRTAGDGSITNGFWVAGVLTKVLNFDATGYVDLGANFDVGGLSAASLAIWLSAEDHFADGNYAICKDGQIAIQHYGTDNRVRFGVYISGSWQWVTSDANISALNGRTFAVGVYDGTNLKLYINGRLHKTQARTGGISAIAASSNNTFIGSKTSGAGFFHGVLAEAMLWNRKLSDQEVLELYFFPLNRLTASRLSSGAQPVIPFSALHQISTDAIAKTCTLGKLLAVVIAYPPFFRFASISTVKAILSPASSRVSSVSTVLAVVIS